MATYLITGASGFLGKYIVAAVRPLNAILTLGRSADCEIQCDLATTIPSINYPVDVVVHAAGKVHSIPVNKEEIAAFFAANTQGTKNLCAALERSSKLPESFVFISTIAVYGMDEGVGITENQPLNGSTPYARSKIEAEQFLTDWCKQRHVILSILRLPLIAGNNPLGNLGAMINGICSGKYFNIDNGKARKSMVMADDIAAFVPIIAAKGGIYNLTDGYDPSFAELSALIARQLHQPAPKNIPYWLAKAMAKVGDILGPNAPINSDKLKKMTATLTFDCTKAILTAGWHPNRVLDRFRIY